MRAKLIIIITFNCACDIQSVLCATHATLFSWHGVEEQIVVSFSNFDVQLDVYIQIKFRSFQQISSRIRFNLSYHCFRQYFQIRKSI